MKPSRLILLAMPTVLMSVAALARAETGTIISPELAPAPVVKPRNDRIAEEERRRAQSARKRASEERRRREAAEQAVARLKSDVAQSEVERQRAANEHRRAEEERRRREAAEQAVARLKSDAGAESERQRQSAQQALKRADEERRRREAAEQTVARLKSDAAAESERQRQRAEQERKRADEERGRREALEQTLARLKSDAAADFERQRLSAEQDRRRADEERGRREAAEQNMARLKTEAAESERQRAASSTLPKPVLMEHGRTEEQRATVPGRDWRRAEMQPHEADRPVERPGTEAGRLEATFAGTELRRDCDVCPRVVAIPAGPLLVASVQVEQPRTGTDVRRPPSPMRTQTWLAVSKFETTFAEWDRCVAERGCRGYTPRDDGRGRGPRPVVNVNYADAEAYIRWLNARAGYHPNDPRRYRLLTEPEWEYAARAGSRTRFFWGDDPTYTEACTFANVADFSLRASFTNHPLPDGNLFRCADQSPYSSWVGRYRSNPWGLHDIIGNVSEIVFTPPGANYMIVRGGSWLSEREFHQSAARGYTRSRDSREYTVGFRVVREVTIPSE